MVQCRHLAFLVALLPALSGATCAPGSAIPIAGQPPPKRCFGSYYIDSWRVGFSPPSTHEITSEGVYNDSLFVWWDAKDRGTNAGSHSFALSANGAGGLDLDGAASYRAQQMQRTAVVDSVSPFTLLSGEEARLIHAHTEDGFALRANMVVVRDGYMIFAGSQSFPSSGGPGFDVIDGVLQSLCTDP